MNKLKLLDCFSGIGGFSLGLERSGFFETVAFCEIEPFPRKILAKHWPKVSCYEDIRTLTAARLAADGIAIDAICGGFPCQDISTAGRQAGIEEGTRSGLWSECLRLTSELRPKYAIFENVANLLSGPPKKPGAWFSRILSDLASIGYDAEWENIRASDIGAKHQRSRIWIVAYPNSERELQSEGRFSFVRGWFGDQSKDVPNANGIRQSRPWCTFNGFGAEKDGDWQDYQSFDDCGWPVEPNICRMAHGVPNGVDRLKSLGNAVVPQIPEMIGSAIGKHYELRNRQILQDGEVSQSHAGS